MGGFLSIGWHCSTHRYVGIGHGFSCGPAACKNVLPGSSVGWQQSMQRFWAKVQCLSGLRKSFLTSVRRERERKGI